MDPNNKFSEKIDKNRLNEQDRKKDINSKIDHFKSNPSHEEDFLNENVLFFKTKGEIIKKEDCEEDINEEILELNTILEDLNKKIIIDVKEEEKDKNQRACQEILEILSIRLPFKPLSQPKKVSMVGKVFYNSSYYNDEIKERNDTNLNNNKI